MQETRVLSLSWKDSLEREIVTHSSILACEIPWTEEPEGLQSKASQRAWHIFATKQQQEYRKRTKNVPSFMQNAMKLGINH